MVFMTVSVTWTSCAFCLELLPRLRGLQGNLKHFYNQKFLKNSYDIRGAMLKKCGF